MKPLFQSVTALALLLAACAPAPAATPDLPPPAVSTGVAQPALASTASLPAEAVPQAAASVEAAPAQLPPTLSGAFVEEEVSVTGSYTYDPAGGQLVFSEDFGVVRGPDLFVILSGAGDLTVDYHAFSAMVVNSPKLALGPLARTAGSQTYFVPEGTDLAQFRTVVIWCETYSVAFAAAPLGQ